MARRNSSTAKQVMDVESDIAWRILIHGSHWGELCTLEQRETDALRLMTFFNPEPNLSTLRWATRRIIGRVQMPGPLRKDWRSNWESSSLNRKLRKATASDLRRVLHLTR